jgi:hypothetical protein
MRWLVICLLVSLVLLLLAAAAAAWHVLLQHRALRRRPFKSATLDSSDDHDEPGI